MDIPAATLALYAIAAAALVTAVGRIRTRLALSKAKHPSLSGHSRMARRVARLMPFYDYDEARFFESDDAPEEVVRTRREAFARLAALYKQRFPLSAEQTAEVERKNKGSKQRFQARLEFRRNSTPCGTRKARKEARKGPGSHCRAH